MSGQAWAVLIRQTEEILVLEVRDPQTPPALHLLKRAPAGANPDALIAPAGWVRTEPWLFRSWGAVAAVEIGTGVDRRWPR